MDTSDNELNDSSNIETYQFQPLNTIAQIIRSRPRPRPRRVYQPIYPSWITNNITNIVHPVQQWTPPSLTIPGTVLTNSDVSQPQVSLFPTPQLPPQVSPQLPCQVPAQVFPFQCYRL